MDFGMSCEELIGDKSTQFSKFTEAFFRQVGLDNVLSRNEDFSKPKTKDDFLKVTRKIIVNINEAKKNIIDKILADSELFIIWKVKPWGEEIDQIALKSKIFAIEMEGLQWQTQWIPNEDEDGTIQVKATFEHDQVSTDHIQEQIEGFTDEVESVDVVDYNKSLAIECK